MMYPKPAVDTGWGFHDSSGCGSRPEHPKEFAEYIYEYGIRWYKALVLGINKLSMIKDFTDVGIECIVRFYNERPHPDYVVSESEVRNYMQVGVHYFEWGNEPNLHCEWNESKWFDLDALCAQWLANHRVISNAGGIPLFPALSPGGNFQHRELYLRMLDWLKGHNQLKTLENSAIAIHNRPLNHPLTYKDSSGCHFLDYEWIDDTIRAYLGHSLPLLATEAGYEVGWKQDTDYPEITENLHAKYNAEIFRGFRENRWRESLYCQCMWLCHNFGHTSFQNAAWHNYPPILDLEAVQVWHDEWTKAPFIRGSMEYSISNWIQQYVIPQNTNAAFYKIGRSLGLEPISREYDYQGYRAQAWYNSKEDMQYILYTRIGDWSNVKIIKRENG